jgi:response regulator RpfG family c-di-GMP phosphodiesterase
MTNTDRKLELSIGAATVLCVDDEPHILSSLRRLLRAEGYRTLTAESGEAGVAILEREQVDLVISDMRMPEMDGAHFLERVRAMAPDTVRVLLTGYADVRSVLHAINRGEIYRYITKPWEDTELLLIVRHAVERKALEQEKRRLEALTSHQNAALRELNASLEHKVDERTSELKDAHAELVLSNEKLKANFLTSIKIFAGLIEMRGENLAGHSRRVADLARRLAKKMGLNAQEIQSVFIAGLLHNIGKVGFSDELLTMPVSLMNGDQLGLYRKYPARGEQLLMPLEDLRGAASLVRSHQERFDGTGFPDGLAGFNIPVGARILALASDFDNLQIGTLAQRRLRLDEAAALISGNRGKRYDPTVVAAFLEISEGLAPSDVTFSVEVVRSVDLKPGMVMARDLVTHDGSLLLSADHVLSERLIQQIIAFETSAGVALAIYVRLARS